MSTPVSRKTLDLDRYRRRMKDRASSTSSLPAKTMTSPPALSDSTKKPTPSSSTPTPKKVMTWKQLEATLTPQERRALLTTRRPKTPNENRPMNEEDKEKGREFIRNLAIATASATATTPPTTTPKSVKRQRLLEKKGHFLGNRSNIKTTPGAAARTSDLTVSTPPPPPDASPKSPELQRLLKKAHLLGNRSNNNKTPPPSPGAAARKALERLTLAASPNSGGKSPRKKNNQQEEEEDLTLLSSTRSNQSFHPTPQSAASTTKLRSSLRVREYTPSSTATSKTYATPRSASLSGSATSAFMTPTTTPSSTRMTTPSTMDRSRTASVDLRRNASVERWRSASRLYARATTPMRSRSKSRERRRSTSTPSSSARRPTTPEPPSPAVARSQSTGSAAKLYARATNSADESCSVTSSSSTLLQTSERRSRSIQKARDRSKTPERRRRPRRTLTPPRPSTTTTSNTGNTTRRNLDKRTARLMHGTTFTSDIHRHRQRSASPRPVHDAERNVMERAQHFGGVSVVVRKRPLFEYELHQGDFDVVFTEARHVDSDAVVVYSTMMHPDMRQMLVKPHAFVCSAAFDEDCSNDDLYRHVGLPLVERVVYGGGMATLLCFGQTGTGKTHTMTGMEERMAVSLFDMLREDECHVAVQFVELSGKQCRDLLEDTGDGVRVAEHEDGSVQLMHAACWSVTNAQELYDVMCYGKRRRATEATGRNGVSSRSHAVCQITVTNNGQRGVLTLLDCAGTERRNDSEHHSRERQKESAEINASLWALKECIRARAAGNNKKSKHTHIPYRSSNLTRILRETLERDDALLCVVATVAPNATDTEHTLETLRTVSTLVGMNGTLEEGETHVVTNSPVKEEELLTPKQWSHSQLVEFLKRKHLLVKDVPERMDGRFVMRLSPVQLKNLLYDNKDHAEKADVLFKSLRAENDRVSRILIKRRLATSRGGGGHMN